MVRQGPLLILALAACAALGAAPPAGAREETPAPEPLDRRPYRIVAHVAVEPDARLDAKGRDALIADWRALTARFVGPPWDLSVAGRDGALDRRPLEALAPAEFAGVEPGVDKVWVIRIGGDSLTGREYDAATRRIGPVHRQATPHRADLPRRLLRLALDLFAPLAEVGEPSGGGILLTVRGASLLAASAEGQVVAVGSVFQPLRVVTLKDGTQRVLGIPFSYLRVESLDGAVARCEIVSALRDPFTSRVVQKSSFLALGIKPASGPTRLRFVTRANKLPAAGYVLTARTLPNGVAREVGTTDREGRIAIPPGFADGLVILRLLAGNVEPMVELPAMPGESEAERTIPFDPKPQTVALEARLDALRDRVIDLVAVRARLEARLKARYDGEDWAGVDATLKEFQQLPTRDAVAAELSRLQDDAALEQAKAKTPILTKTAQAQLAEVRAMVDRYLDDEVVKGYQEAMDKTRSAGDAKEKPAAKPAPRGAAPAGN